MGVGVYPPVGMYIVPVVDDGQEDSHEHVEVDDQVDHEEDGEPALVVVGRHHDVRTVGGRDEDEQVPKRIRKIVEVRLTSNFCEVFVLRENNAMNDERGFFLFVFLSSCHTVKVLICT